MKTSDFYYDLPKELIAQDPLEDRSSSRLLVLHRKSGQVEHRVFTDIVEYLRPGDCLVRNNTKVIPARLYGTREDTGAMIELLLLKRRENDVWETLKMTMKEPRANFVCEVVNNKIYCIGGTNNKNNTVATNEVLIVR